MTVSIDISPKAQSLEPKSPNSSCARAKYS
jgi:hypothetical protein